MDTSSKKLLASTKPGDLSLEECHDGNGNTLKELKLYLSEVIRDQMGSILNAITDLTNTVKNQNLRIEQLEARVAALESKSDVATLEKTVSQLQVEVSDRDQALLINDIEISGCPETVNENCVHLILTIANKMGVEMDEKDVVSAERLGRVQSGENDNKPSRARLLAVRLARKDKREALLRAARVRRNLNTDGLQLSGPVNSIYINERLTKSNRLLFHRARLLVREYKYKFVWTRDGKIYVRQDSGMKGHRIHSEADLLRVFGKL